MSSHRIDWIITDCCPLFPALLDRYVFSLQNVLNLEGSWSRLFEESIAKAYVCAFSYLSVPHNCCYWFIWKMFDIFVSMYYVHEDMCTNIRKKMVIETVIFWSHLVHTSINRSWKSLKVFYLVMVLKPIFSFFWYCCVQITYQNRKEIQYNTAYCIGIVKFFFFFLPKLLLSRKGNWKII